MPPRCTVTTFSLPTLMACRVAVPVDDLLPAIAVTVTFTAPMLERSISTVKLVGNVIDSAGVMGMSSWRTA